MVKLARKMYPFSALRVERFPLLFSTKRSKWIQNSGFIIFPTKR